MLKTACANISHGRAVLTTRRNVKDCRPLGNYARKQHRSAVVTQRRGIIGCQARDRLANPSPLHTSFLNENAISVTTLE